VRSLNNVTTADTYTAANTLQAPGTVKVNLYVANAAIYYNLTQPEPGPRQPGGGSWGPEVFLTPGRYNLARNTSGIRVRSGAAGVPAQVTVEALDGND